MLNGYDGKYKALTEYLVRTAESVQPMTFGAIEEVLGFALPESARKHPAWWANQLRGQSLAWIVAGFNTSAVSVDEERLTFISLDHPDMQADVEPPLTLVEAKQRLAQTFGVDPSQVEITIRI